MDLESIKEQTRAFHRDKRWIVAVDVAAGATQLVERLYDEGAAGVMVVAGTRGVGDIPIGADIHYTGSTGTTVMDGIRSFLATIERPSEGLLAAVDLFDPTGEAMVLGDGFSREHILCGRPVYGARQRRWRALEDKMVADAIWERAGVANARHEIVDVSHARAAAQRLRSDLGTVWTADNREGWHGGGEYTRWLRTAAEEPAAVEWFSAHADRIRVMPFLDGIPCSIHGFVTDDGVAAFLPFELFILRPRAANTFFYAQGANYWNPPAWVESEMRSAARAVGQYLKGEYGYRGAFGIDGVATIEGFRPNELNPRLTIAVAVQARIADVNIGDIERGILAGTLDVPARLLEDSMVGPGRTTRGGGAVVMIHAEHDPDTVWLDLVDGGVVAATEEDHDLTVTLGPAAFGSIALIRVEEGAVDPGPSFAPRVVQVIDHIRDLWGLDLPHLDPAPDVFRL